MNPKSFKGAAITEFQTSVSVTQRDYFAAKAMNGLLAAGRDAQYEGNSMSHLSKISYELADAMLKAREA